MIVLSKDQVISMHKELIDETGGIHGLKDEGLLESALAAPFQTYDGRDLFPSVFQKAARLGYGLSCNHAFIDGNKRIGAHTMLVFLYLNHIELSYDQDELSDLFLDVSAGNKGYEDILDWILMHNGLLRR